MAKVFISYRGNDAQKAQRLAKGIRKAGHKVWLDQWKIRIGDSIVGRINEGVAEADCLVLCYSSSGDSSWTKGEWESALFDQLSGGKIKILPVMLTDGQVPHILRPLRWVNLTKNWSKGVAELLRGIKQCTTRGVSIAYAEGEEKYAKELENPLRKAGYKVSHRGIVEASEILSSGGALVVCGTVIALGSKWTRHLVDAAHKLDGVRVFVVQMEEEADVDTMAFDGKFAFSREDPKKAIDDLTSALKRYYPLRPTRKLGPRPSRAEQQYRVRSLESCNIIDLANLPENDISITTKRPELSLLYVPQRVRVETASAEEAGAAAFESMRRSKRSLRRAQSTAAPTEIEKMRRSEPMFTIGSHLTKSQKLVVLGEPGAGKTTLLRWIATAYLLQLERPRERQAIPGVESLPRENWLPLIVRCRDLDKRSLSGRLWDIIYHVLCRAEIEKAETVATSFLNKLKHGRALLLIDGLDEIADLTARRRFCEQLETISRVYEKAPMIVTSRIVGYREMQYRIDKFEHVALADFSKEDKDEFARRWCYLSERPMRREAATAELIRDIHSTDRIERLTGNPMLLTAMALVKGRFGRLRIRKSELYWDLLEVLLYWRHEVEEPLDKDEAIPQLEYLAYEMCDRGLQRLQSTDIVKLLESMRTEYPQIHPVQKHSPQDFLKLLERLTEILIVAEQVRRAGMRVSVYEFRHSIFREYLAARALVDGRSPGRNPKLSLASNVARLAGRTSKTRIPKSGAVDVAITETWREVLRLCIASCHDDDVDSVLLAILKPMKGENSETTARPRAVLAALCLADEPNVTDEVAREVLRRFVREIGLNDGNHYGTSVDNAVQELASSQWAGKLQEALDRELKNRVRRSDESHYKVASLGLFLSVERAVNQTASENERSRRQRMRRS